MNLVQAIVRQWWAWSTGPGKRRKAIGFGVPLLVLVMLISALTPHQPEAAGDRFATPTAAVSPAPPETPAATVTVGSSLPPQSSSLPAASPSAVATLLPDGREVAVVQRVIDGDTIVLADDRHVRYIGMDTPETVDPGELVQCYGPEASARNKALVEGQTVLLETDVSDTDIYGRLLRYVYLEDGRMVNEILVAEGYAKSIAYPPDTKYQERFDAAQAEAMSQGLGLWSACEDAQSPTATPVVVPTAGPSSAVSQCPQGCTEPVDGCVIKGNISSGSSERIYHVPGQRDYENTIIDAAKGERWFCTEAEAVANGWRKAQR